MPFATAWVELEDIMLSKISKTKKTTARSHSCGISNIPTHRSRQYNGDFHGLGREDNRVMFVKSCKVSILQDE